MSWQEVALGDLASVESGGGAPQDPSAFGNEGLPFFRAGSLPKLLSGASEDELEKIHPEVAKRFKLKAFPAGTLLFAKSGMSATKGHIYRMRQPGYVVNHLAALVPSDEPTGQYLTHVLAYRSPVNLIQDAAYPSIRLSDISRFTIPAPKNARERERIAAILDKADALRKQRRRAIALLDSLRQSIFLEMFGDELQPIIKFGDVVIEFRYGTSRKSARKGIPTLRIPNIIDSVISVEDLKYVPVDPKEFDRLSLRNGDLLFVRTNGNRQNVGRSAVVDDKLSEISGRNISEFIFASYLIRARVKTEIISPFFLQAYLSNAVGRAALLERCKTSAGQYNINTESLASIPLPLPDMKKQKDFQNRILKIRSAGDQNTVIADRLESLFSSLQHRAFSGQL